MNISVTEMSVIEKKKMVQKLHRQFRHQTASRTENLMQRAGILTPELKQMNIDVAANYEVCK